ncbi:hypothetical protein DFJ73DRAFT_765228 [Zopfochytrium polystomum]|nr:hypothetical protein DFJ73DRAFT_765228 [Zopfochytrium polystomum]
MRKTMKIDWKIRGKKKPKLYDSVSSLTGPATPPSTCPPPPSPRKPTRRCKTKPCSSLNPDAVPSFQDRTCRCNRRREHLHAPVGACPAEVVAKLGGHVGEEVLKDDEERARGRRGKLGVDFPRDVALCQVADGGAQLPQPVQQLGLGYRPPRDEFPLLVDKRGCLLEKLGARHGAEEAVQHFHLLLLDPQLGEVCAAGHVPAPNCREGKAVNAVNPVGLTTLIVIRSYPIGKYSSDKQKSRIDQVSVLTASDALLPASGVGVGAATGSEAVNAVAEGVLVPSRFKGLLCFLPLKSRCVIFALRRSTPGQPTRLPACPVWCKDGVGECSAVVVAIAANDNCLDRPAAPTAATAATAT